MSGRTIAKILVPMAMAMACLLVIILSSRRSGEPRNVRFEGRLEDKGAATGDHAGHAHNGGRSREVVPTLGRDGRPGTVRGRVSGPRASLPGICVAVSGEGELPWVLSARSGADGEYALSVPPGRMTVRARSKHYLDSRDRDIWLRPGGTEVVDFTLSRKTRVCIRVRSKGGAARISGAGISLVHSGSGETYTAACGRDGECEFASLPRGEYRLAVEAPGYAAGPATPRVLCVSGAEPGLEVPLHVSSRISGTVRDGEGRPVSGAEVKAAGKGGAPFQTLSGEDGTYVLDVLPGRVAVTATHPDFAPAIVGRVEALSGGWVTADIALSPGMSLAGRVKGLSGSPLPGALVRAQWFGPGTGLSHLLEVVACDGDGRFRLDHLGEGIHVVGAEADGFSGRYREIFIPGAGKPLTLDFELGGGHGLSGRVVDRGGIGIEGVEVRVRADGGEGRVLSGEGGRFAISGLPAGPWEVEFGLEGFVPKVRRGVDPKAGQVQETLHRMGSLAGRVEYKGIGQEGVEVLATGEENLAFRKYTRPGGRFRFTALPPGTYRLEAKDIDFRGEAVPVEVAEGGEETGVVIVIEQVG